jgi:hypothetical protein
LKLVADRMSFAGKEVMHEWVCPHRGTSNKEAFAGVQDVEFGCCGRCHACIRAVCGALSGHGCEADRTRLRCNGFESGCCSCSVADNVDVVNTCSDFCFRMCCGCALKRALEREGKKKESQGVLLFHAARPEDGG